MIAAPQPPLCVDLDGTLLRGDTLHISLRLMAGRQPWLLPLLPLVLLLRGRPALKRFISSRILPDPAALPWRPDVVGFVRQERASGRSIILATAADRAVAERIAAFLGLFDGVVATDRGTNVKGDRKVDAIRKSLQSKDFDYIGDSRADLPVFRAARKFYLVAPGAALRRATAGLAGASGVFE